MLGALVEVLAARRCCRSGPGYPDARDRRSRRAFVVGALIARGGGVLVLLLDAVARGMRPRVFFHRTFGYQFGRDSPFSLWDWRQYHAKGLPDLHWLQHVLQAALVAGALALYRWPRRRSPLQLAAFTGALLVGFELVLTHWSYLYLPWFFPFVAFALLRRAEAPDAEQRGRSGPLRDLRQLDRDADELAARRAAVARRTRRARPRSGRRRSPPRAGPGNRS